MAENEVAGPELFGPIDLLKLWRKLQDLAGDFDLKGFAALLNHLWPIPNWDDSEAVRTWCRALIGATEMCAELTPTPLDDQAVAALATIIRNDEAWAAWYKLFRSLTGKVVVGADRERAKAIASVAGVNADAVIRSAVGMAEHADWLSAQPRDPA